MIISYGTGLALIIDGLGGPSSSIGFGGTPQTALSVIMFLGTSRRMEVKLQQSDGTFVPPQDNPEWDVDDHTVMEIGTITQSRQAVTWNAITVGTTGASFSTVIDGVERSVFFNVQVVAPDAVIVEGPVIEIL